MSAGARRRQLAGLQPCHQACGTARRHLITSRGRSWRSTSHLSFPMPCAQKTKPFADVWVSLGGEPETPGRAALSAPLQAEGPPLSPSDRPLFRPCALPAAALTRLAVSPGGTDRRGAPGSGVRSSRAGFNNRPPCEHLAALLRSRRCQRRCEAVPRSTAAGEASEEARRSWWPDGRS